MIKRLCIGVALVACSWTQAQASQQYVFEKADVLLRPKLNDPFDVEHVGLYLGSNSVWRFTKAQAVANALPDNSEHSQSDGLHSAIHIPGTDTILDPVTGKWNEGITWKLPSLGGRHGQARRLGRH